MILVGTDCNFLPSIQVNAGQFAHFEIQIQEIINLGGGSFYLVPVSTAQAQTDVGRKWPCHLRSAVRQTQDWSLLEIMYFSITHVRISYQIVLYFFLPVPKAAIGSLF